MILQAAKPDIATLIYLAERKDQDAGGYLIMYLTELQWSAAPCRKRATKQRTLKKRRVMQKLETLKTPIRDNLDDHYNRLQEENEKIILKKGFFE